MNVPHIQSPFMQHIVLDTNCLIMAVSANNDYYKVWQDFLDGKYILCVSNDILEEYVANRGEHRYLFMQRGSSLASVGQFSDGGGTVLWLW